MKSRALWWQLLRIGLRAGRHAHGGALRFMALITASTVMTIFFLSALMVIASYDGRTQRDLARGAEHALGRKSPAVALYAPDGDSIAETPHTVIYIEPISPAAAPPPGLPRWPEPGEVFLSPELVRAGAAEHITSRYGTLAGLIRPEGLSSLEERLAYVRPKVDNHRAWFKISRIGSANARLIGDSRDAVPMGQFLATIVLTLGGAATVLLVVAARCGSATRDRRAQLLAALGGSARHRALINLGEGLVPALIGMALGSAPYLIMMTMSIRLPVTGYITNPADLRAWSWAIPLVATGACTVVLLAVIGLHRVTMDGGSTRPRTFGARIPSWRLAAGVIGLVSIIITPYLPKVASFFGYIGGTALLWGMLPSAAGVLIRRLGASAAAFGTWAGHAAALVAGRWAQARPGVIVRLVAVVVIGLGMITQAQVWTSRLGDSTQNAQRMRQQIQDSVLIVSSSSMTRTGIDNFADLLPNKSSLVAVISAPESERTPELRASCPTIRDLGLVCSPTPAHLGEGDARARALNGSIGFMTGQTNLREGNTSGNVPTVLAVISPLDSHNLAWRVKKAAYQSLGKARVERPYDSWILGADRLVQMAEWVKLLTAVVLGILFLSVVYSSAAEFLVFTSALAPLAVLSEQRRFLVGIAVWNLTLPTALATAIGAGVAAWQGMFFVGMSRSGVFSWTTLEVSSIVALSLAVGLGVTGGLGAVGVASRWRPAAD